MAKKLKLLSPEEIRRKFRTTADPLDLEDPKAARARSFGGLPPHDTRFPAPLKLRKRRK